MLVYDFVFGRDESRPYRVGLIVVRNRRSIRLPGYDYSSDGWYFVTICTKNKECLLGEIDDEKMILNHVGKIVESVWFLLQKRYGVELDQFQIMPNHIHGIISIKCRGLIHQTQELVTGYLGVMNHAPTLGQIVRFFKAKSTKMIHDIDPNIAVWLRNYYERIIRNEKELNNVREYIRNNPLMWEKDEENPKRIGLPTKM